MRIVTRSLDTLGQTGVLGRRNSHDSRLGTTRDFKSGHTPDFQIRVHRKAEFYSSNELSSSNV